MAGLMVKMMGPGGRNHHRAGLIVSVCGAACANHHGSQKFCSQTSQSIPAHFCTPERNKLFFIRFTVADQHLCANLSGAHLADRFRDYNTLLIIASEMILVPYFVGVLAESAIATRLPYKAVGFTAFMAYGYCTPLWSMHLPLSVVLYMRRGYYSVRVKRIHMIMYWNRQEMVPIGMLLIAPVPATGCWWDNVHPIVG